MKRIPRLRRAATTAGLWLVLAGPSALAAGPPRANLVNNPGFELPAAATGLPGGGWWFFQGLGAIDVRQDAAVAYAGRGSVRLHASEESKGVLVSAPFAVAPGDELEFQTRVRGAGLPAAHPAAYAGLAFRRADGSVFARSYFVSPRLGDRWGLVAGTAVAPADAVSAEVHLGYTNAPGTVWFDDVSAVITTPVSFALAGEPQPWAGTHELPVRVTNRKREPFKGSVTAMRTSERRSGGASERGTVAVPVVVGPGETREFKIPVTLVGVGVRPWRFALLDAGGTEVRSLQARFRTSPPLVLYPPFPAWHMVGQGDGRTRVEARVNVDPVRRAGFQLAVALVDRGGRIIQSASAKNGDAEDGVPTVELQVPVVAAARFNVQARLLDPAGREVAAATTHVGVTAPEQARVLVGPDGFLRVAGQAEVPLGLYNCGRYEEMARAGFNATHEYGIVTGEPDAPINPRDAEVLELLDRSWTNGMRMMVELPRKAIEKAQWDQVRRRILTFRHHPGLLCWGSEERVARGTAPLSHIAALYQLVRQLDPDHPLVLGDTRDVIQKFRTDRRDFFPDSAMDIGIWWWYPIPLKGSAADPLAGEEAGATLEPPSWLTTTTSRKPLWIAIQAYQKPNKDARFPTPAEYRCQAYLSFINGAKGLFFYTGSGQRDYQGRPSGLLNKPVEAHWDYVKQLVAELKTMSPILMSPKCGTPFELAPAGSPVEWTTRQSTNGVYLIVANKSPQAQSIRFSSEALKGRGVQLMDSAPAPIPNPNLNHNPNPNPAEKDKPELKTTGGVLLDELPPFGVRIYRLTGRA